MKARKQGEIALKAAEQLREKAQDSALQLKDSSEQRLVKQLAAQRWVEGSPCSAALVGGWPHMEVRALSGSPGYEFSP